MAKSELEVKSLKENTYWLSNQHRATRIDRKGLLRNSYRIQSIEVVLRYQVEVDGPVRVAVYSTLGVQVRLLADQIQEAGVWTLRWNGSDQRGFPMASGVYLLVIDANGERRSRKVMLIR